MKPRAALPAHWREGATTTSLTSLKGVCRALAPLSLSTRMEMARYAFGYW